MLNIYEMAGTRSTPIIEATPKTEPTNDQKHQYIP